MRKRLLLLVVLLICSTWSPLKAQDDITNIFKSGIADLNTVAKGYLTPAGNAFAAGMGSNWYNTAETHKVLGFDIKIGANVTISPISDQSFSLTGLTNLKANDPSITEAPSFTGKGDGVQLNLMQPQYLSDGTTENPLYKNGTGVITSFTSPSGISRYVPSASVQLTVGLPFKNDLMVRFVPTVKTNGVEVSLWGVGVKNNFIKLIPGLKLLPFDASVLIAYNQLDLKYAFPASDRITPEDLVGEDVEYISDPNSNDYSTQGMKLSATSLTANIIVSKKFLLLTPYVGFGFTKTSFDLKMTGNYPTLGDPVNTGNNTYKMQIINETDPIDVSSNQVMPGATVGLRFKVLFIFTANAQYTFQKYPTASIGFAIGMR
jgi:hypothetical protein